MLSKTSPLSFSFNFSTSDSNSCVTFLDSFFLFSPFSFFSPSDCLSGDENGNCWFDGTCRHGGGVHKSNFRAQQIYDATLILLILSLVPFMFFLHHVWYMKVKNHH